MPPISWHALTRMTEMGVTPEALAAVLDRPENDYPCLDNPTRRMRQRGNLCVCYAIDDGTIITVLWRTDRHYQR